MSLDVLSDWGESEQPTTLQLQGRRGYTQRHWSGTQAAKELIPMSLDVLSDWGESEQPTTLQLQGKREY